MDLKKIFSFIPEVKRPSEKNLSFNVKLKWTLIILCSFFVLANIPLFGLSANALSRFEYLAILLGTDFGSIISLGIGPIVMASIILQLLTGAGIISINTSTVEGKKFFQGVQKLLVFFMDDVTSKWGFGSGVSLFIAAGVSWRLFTSAFQVINQQGKNCLLDFSNTACSGKVFVLIQSIINRYPIEFVSALAAILATLVIFLLVVWAQSLKVEIPLSFGKVRGYGVKWPLSFFYASVIPVILTAALIANLQLFGGLLENASTPCLSLDGEGCTSMAKFASYFGFLGHFVDGQAISGLAFWMGSTNILELFIRGGLLPKYFFQAFTHILVFMFFSTIFAVFWVKTAGMDAKAQAQKIAASGLQVAGFRQDIRILESILDRYIMPLTIMGGMAIGLLASITDLLGALVSGTAILLVIMIMFQMYQNIAKQHATDMNPAMAKFIGN